MFGNSAFFSPKTLLQTTDQTKVFIHYGCYPYLDKSFTSIFRPTDRNAGCRFEVRDGILYFVDNARFNGKLFFNAYDTIMAMENCDYGTAIKRYREIIDNSSETTSIDTRYDSMQRADIQIWDAPFIDGHVFSEFDLPAEYLNQQPDIHNVIKYTIDGRPYRRRCIGYSCNGHYKLYFRGLTKNKFLSNFTNEDIMCVETIDWDAPILCITKSRLEAAILKYHLNLQSIVQLNEAVMLPRELRDKVELYHKSGGRVIVLMDNDDTGIAMAEIYKKTYGFENYTPIRDDIADDYKLDKLTRFKNEISIYNR